MPYTWNRKLEMTFDLSNLSARSLDVVEADIFSAKLRFVSSSEALNIFAYPTRIPAGSVLVLTAKTSVGFLTSPLLIYTASWTEVADPLPDGADASSTTYYYEGVINVNTTPIVEAMEALSANSSKLAIQWELEIQNSDNTQRASIQFGGNILRQVYEGDNTPVAEPTFPVYPEPEDIVLLGNKASTAEAEAGVNDTKWMTPLKTNEAIIAQCIQDITGLTVLPNESNRRYVWAGTSTAAFVSLPELLGDVTVTNLGLDVVSFDVVDVRPGETVTFETDVFSSASELLRAGIPDPQTSVTGQGLVWVAATRTWAPAAVDFGASATPTTNPQFRGQMAILSNRTGMAWAIDTDTWSVAYQAN